MTEKTDHDMLVEMHGGWLSLCKEVGALQKEVFGNGEPGLKKRVTVMEVKFAILWWIAGIITLSIVTTAVAAVWALIVK